MVWKSDTPTAYSHYTHCSPTHFGKFDSVTSDDTIPYLFVHDDSLDEFELEPDSTLDCGVSCP